VLRFEIREDGGEPLPPIDLADAEIVIGSAPDAKIRLPASAAKPEHVRVRAAEVGDGKTFEIGRYRVRVAPAPAGAAAASPQRTESLARELVRGLLGAGAAPSLEVETGPRAGARRSLAPPESRLVIGRGDEAGWIIDDEDLSRAHAEVRRGWDGAWLRDLGSKNGTRVDGAAVGGGDEDGDGDGAVELRDGAVIELGKVRVRFRDPAEKHLRGEAASASTRARARASTSTSTSTSTSRGGSAVVFYAALGVCLVAIAGLIWVLTA
jgi:predicted component of type VI protein secretion system